MDEQTIKKRRCKGIGIRERRWTSPKNMTSVYQRKHIATAPRRRSGCARRGLCSQCLESPIQQVLIRQLMAHRLAAVNDPPCQSNLPGIQERRYTRLEYPRTLTNPEHAQEYCAPVERSPFNENLLDELEHIRKEGAQGLQPRKGRRKHSLLVTAQALKRREVRRYPKEGRNRPKRRHYLTRISAD